MKIFVWAHSYCRSTMATYASLRQSHRDDVKIVVLGRADPTLRLRAGFSSSEFSDVDIDGVNLCVHDAVAMLSRHSDWLHVFCDYQSRRTGPAVLREAQRRGLKYIIASEAPLNMESQPLRRAAKEFYLRVILPYNVKSLVRSSLGFVNFSGGSGQFLSALGWKTDAVLPFGYFSPPLPQSQVTLQQHPGAGPLQIVMSGSHTWHRDPMTFVRALALLNSVHLGKRVHATICGDGPLTDDLRAFCNANGLNVNFPGFVGLDELRRIYEASHLFVASGRAEPWGIRVNDAINCGCIPIVSEGMGIAGLLKTHAYGDTFPASDSRTLASIIARYVSDAEYYAVQIERLPDAVRHLSPAVRAKELLNWTLSQI